MTTSTPPASFRSVRRWTSASRQDATECECSSASVAGFIHVSTRWPDLASANLPTVFHKDEPSGPKPRRDISGGLRSPIEKLSLRAVSYKHLRAHETPEQL